MFVLDFRRGGGGGERERERERERDINISVTHVRIITFSQKKKVSSQAFLLQ